MHSNANSKPLLDRARNSLTGHGTSVLCAVRMLLADMSDEDVAKIIGGCYVSNDEDDEPLIA